MEVISAVRSQPAVGVGSAMERRPPLLAAGSTTERRAERLRSLTERRSLRALEESSRVRRIPYSCCWIKLYPTGFFLGNACHHGAGLLFLTLTIIHHGREGVLARISERVFVKSYG